MTPTSANQALTLADYAMQSKDPLQQKITLSLLGDFSILDDLPLVTNSSLKVEGRRITGKDLPDTGWGRINQPPVPVKTTMRPYEDQVALVREIIPIDRRLLRQKNWIDNPVDTQIKGIMEAHRYDMNWAFFHNFPEGPAAAGNNPDAWISVKARLADPLKYGLAPNLTINKDIDLTDTGLTGEAAKTNTNLLMEALGQGFARLGAADGDKVIVYTNWLLKERWARGLRQGGGGGFNIVKDAFDREIEKYRKATVRDAGWRKDETTEMISNSLDVNGKDVNGGLYTELLMVRMGDDYLKGWQTEELKPENLGRSTETGIFENVLIDWGCGFTSATTRPFVRITGLKVKSA